MNDKIIDIIKHQLGETIHLFNAQAQIQDILYQYIVEQYESITGEIVLNESKKTICEKIWTWYYDTHTYDNAQGKPGCSRSVSRTTRKEEYHFDIPYQQKQFKENILNNVHVRREFITHVCVAFRFDQNMCNNCLQAYGYLPLHSKNLHDLAVYSVLSTIDHVHSNPLLLVKERYFKALELMKNGPYDSSAVGSIETRILTNKIELQEFSEERFVAYVSENAQYLNRRHSAILNEHNRLVKVFQHLYDNLQQGTEWSKEESQYSLFSFINRFCKKIDYDHFGERLINQIQRDGKKASRENRHPTREMMIILWLYEEFFRGCEPLLCPAKYTASMERDFWEDAHIFGEKRTKFDINNCLFGNMTIRKKVKTVIDSIECYGVSHFDGADVQQLINERLDKYGYNMLSDSNSSFDRLIIKLLTLKIYYINNDSSVFNREPAYYCEFCGKESIDLKDDYAHIIENYQKHHIPISLALAFEILGCADKLNRDVFEEIKHKHKKSKDNIKPNKLLACNLSSQI